MVWEILIVGLLVYVGLAAYLYFFQAGYIYFPFRELEGTPASVRLEYQDVSLTSADGVTLTGWYVPAKDARGTLLFCHGNGGNISHRLESLTIFHALGVNVFIFDYRGYGASEGEPSEEGTYLDAQAAWRYLTEERSIAPSDIVIFGRSLGGAIASHLAMRRSPRALILESTFTSVSDMAAGIYWYMPVRLLCRFAYTTERNVAEVKCPVLVVHSRQDELVPFRQGRRVFEAAPDPKEFLEMRGGHNDGFLVTGGSYERGLDAFLSRYLTGEKSQ
jgi:fermentation-respiration switch protein FrsA (DUF1100 family)